MHSSLFTTTSVNKGVPFTRQIYHISYLLHHHCVSMVIFIIILMGEARGNQTTAMNTINTRNPTHLNEYNYTRPPPPPLFIRDFT